MRINIAGWKVEWKGWKSHKLLFFNNLYTYVIVFVSQRLVVGHDEIAVNTHKLKIVVSMCSQLCAEGVTVE